MRKKEVEQRLAECHGKLAAVKAQYHKCKEQRAELAVVLKEAQRTRIAALGQAGFDDLLAEITSRIEHEIDVSAAYPARHWSLLTIRKGLKQL